MKFAGHWFGIGLLGLILLLACADKKQLAAFHMAEGDRRGTEGAYEQAIDAYRRAIDLQPRRVEAYLSLARAFNALGQYAAALDTVQQALRLDPATGEGQALLGEIHLATGAYQEALAAFERVAALEPGDFGTALGMTAARLGSAGLLISPVHPGTSAVGLERNCRIERIVDGTDLQPILVQLRKAWEMANTPQQAEPLRRIAARLHWWEAQNLRGSGEYGQAIEAYRRCLKLDPEVGEARGELAIRYAYDEGGNPLQRVDENGDTTRYAHDALDRLVGIEYPHSPGVAFEYDAAGNLMGVEDPTGQTKYFHDGLERPVAVEYPDGTLLTYQYDADGRLGQIRGAGHTVRYAYGAAGYRVRVTGPSGEVGYSFNAAGDLVERILPNGISTRYAYDAVGRPLGAEHRAGEKVLLAYRYRLDAAGRPLSMQRLTPGDTLSAEFAYDAVGRPVEERYADGRRARYAYDAAGNRVQRLTAADTIRYAYSREHRLRLAGAVWYEYDRRGNLKVRTSPQGERRYQYDDENRLVAIEADGRTVTFQYRGDGRRWARTEDGEKRYFVAAVDDRVVMQVDTTGRLEDMRVGGEWLGGNDGFYLYDRAGGNPVALCDSAGQVLARWEYGIFGEAVADSGGREGPRGFRGGCREPETGLVYLNGRYYDPAIGRFLTPEDSFEVPLLRFANPYADIEFAHRRDGVQDELLARVLALLDDPFSRLVEEALEDRYQPPVSIVPAVLDGRVGGRLRDDPRLPPLLGGTMVGPWSERLWQPEDEGQSLQLPLPAAGDGQRLSELAVEAALAHIAQRWRWEPGQRQEHLARAHGTGGIVELQGEFGEPDPSGLDGYERLFTRDLVSPDSLLYGAYERLVSRSARGMAALEEFQNFLENAPEGAWTPQVQLLLGRQLLREERLDEAESLLAAAADEWFAPVWGDQFAMARMLVAEKRRDPEAVGRRYAELCRDFPESEWRDDGLFVLGRALQKAGRHGDALECLASFGEGFPESVWSDERVFRRPLSRYLERISRITSAIFEPLTRQLILAGEEDPSLPPVDMDDFVVALRAIYRLRQDPAVSIGTEPSGVRRYKKVRYDGGTQGTSFGRTMFDADYLLKSLSIGRDSTRQVGLELEDFKSLVDWSLELDPLMLGFRWNSRVWFVQGEVVVRRTHDGNGILIDAIPMEVLSESRFFHRSVRQPSLDAFAQYLNGHVDYLTDGYAAVRKLSQLAQWVAIAKWMRDYRIPVDLDWLDGYPLKAVETPELVPASDVARRFVRDGAPLSLNVEGGVSFREPNYYELAEDEAARTRNEVLDKRPADGGVVSWSYRSAGKEVQAVGVPLGTSVRDGQLILRHTDVGGVDADGPQLSRYYDSFDARSGIFGRGWTPFPYSLRLRRELSGAPGEREPAAESQVAVLIDRPNGRWETLDIHSPTVRRVGRGRRLQRHADGSSSLLQAGGQLDFDPEGRLLRIAGSSGQVVSFRYQGKRLVGIGDAAGREIRLSHDGRGRVVRADGPGGGTASYHYDGRGDLAWVDDAVGRRTTYQYDAHHRLVQSRPQARRGFRASYDPAGRVRTYLGQDGQAVSFSYDLNTRRTIAVDRRGRKRVRQFDGQWRTLGESDGPQRGAEFTYSGTGELMRIDNARGGVIELAYDRKGELVEIRGPFDRHMRLSYGSDGLAEMHYPGGRKRSFAYDESGRLGKVVDSLESGDAGWRLEMEYGARGWVARMKTASGTDIRFERDGAGRVAALSEGEYRRAEAIFDAQGRVVQVADSAGREVGAAYDGFGRLTAIHSAVGTLAYEYDENGRLLRLIGPEGGTTSLEYDDGRLARVLLGDGGMVEYTYNDRERRVSVIDPLGGERRCEFDARGRATGVVSLPLADRVRTGRAGVDRGEVLR